MTTSLKGQVAWITGGGSGIGLAGAIELVKAGAHVVISGRTAATNASALAHLQTCLLYTSPSPRDGLLSRMPSSA